MPGARCTRGLVRKRKCGVLARAYRLSGGTRHTAPLVGTGWRGVYRCFFPPTKRNIFRRGLDDPNQFEFVWQIKFCVKSNFRRAGSRCIAIAARDLPVGQISRRAVVRVQSLAAPHAGERLPITAYDCDAFTSGRCSLAMVSPNGPVLTRSGAALSGFSRDSSGNTSSAKR